MQNGMNSTSFAVKNATSGRTIRAAAMYNMTSEVFQYCAREALLSRRPTAGLLNSSRAALVCSRTGQAACEQYIRAWGPSHMAQDKGEMLASLADVSMMTGRCIASRAGGGTRLLREVGGGDGGSDEGRGNDWLAALGRTSSPTSLPLSTCHDINRFLDFDSTLEQITKVDARAWLDNVILGTGEALMGYAGGIFGGAGITGAEHTSP